MSAQHVGVYENELCFPGATGTSVVAFLAGWDRSYLAGRYKHIYKGSDVVEVAVPTL